MLFVYGKSLCSACMAAKEYLNNASVEYTPRDFDMDKMSKDRPEDVIAMAMYHYQEELLPVFVLGTEGLTFSELQERIFSGASLSPDDTGECT